MRLSWKLPTSSQVGKRDRHDDKPAGIPAGPCTSGAAGLNVNGKQCETNASDAPQIPAPGTANNFTECRNALFGLIHRITFWRDVMEASGEIDRHNQIFS
jgi:hypothetical protein